MDIARYTYTSNLYYWLKLQENIYEKLFCFFLLLHFSRYNTQSVSYYPVSLYKCIESLLWILLLLHAYQCEWKRVGVKEAKKLLGTFVDFNRILHRIIMKIWFGNIYSTLLLIKMEIQQHRGRALKGKGCF